ncbi:hypothetical protein D9M70_238240 [compost metagenome]
MQNAKLIRLCNLALRSSIMASKFLLVFLLARFLSPAELGLFGLLSATIGYSLYLLGFDFYTFSTREMLKLEPTQWGELIKNQGATFLLLYVIVLPLLTLIFAKGLLPWKYSGWFFALIIIEHLTQELGRLLIAISEPLFASLILFLRQGIWGPLVIVAMLLAPETRTLDYVLGGWCIGGLCGLLLGLYKLYNLKLGNWHKKIDWAWIVHGLKIAAALLVATLALRGVLTLDRYWLQALSGAEVLGAYIIYISIGNALMSFLDAGVFSFLYPALISSWQKKDPTAFLIALRRLATQTIIVSAIFFISALLLISPLLHWLGKEVYISHKDMFPWILSATTLYGLGMIPHYALYALGRDKTIILSHLLSLPIFALTTWALSFHSKTLAVPGALLGTFIFILIWKAGALFALRHEITSQLPTHTANA